LQCHYSNNRDTSGAIDDHTPRSVEQALNSMTVLLILREKQINLIRQRKIVSSEKQQIGSYSLDGEDNTDINFKKVVSALVLIKSVMKQKLQRRNHKG